MLRHLPMFCVLGEERHFRRAAERLGTSQSAISRQLLDLETALGFALIARSTRAVELTPAGAQLLAEIGPLVGQIETAVENAREVAIGKRGLLQVGFTAAAMHGFGAPAIQALRTELPGVTVNLNEMTTDGQVAALRSRTIDIALLHPPIDAQGLLMREVGLDRMVLAVARHHSLTERPAGSIRLADLADEAFILYPRSLGPALYDDIVAVSERAGFRPRIAQHCASWTAAINLAGTGVGAAWIPRSFMASSHNAVSYVELIDDVPRLPYALAVRRPTRRPLVEQARQIIEASANNFFSSPSAA